MSDLITYKTNPLSSYTFKWYKGKANRNYNKHRVYFAEAATVFSDPLAITVGDVVHTEDIERFITIGWSHQQRTLVVVHRLMGEAINIISARIATRKERNSYEEGKEAELPSYVGGLLNEHLCRKRRRN